MKKNHTIKSLIHLAASSSGISICNGDLQVAVKDE
jgi:hypothetical protein